MKKKLIRIALGIVVVYAIACIAFFNFQERFLFYPTPLEADYSYQFEVPYEEITLNTPDGASLNMVQLKADSAKSAIFYIHGNAGNNQSWGDVMGPITYFGQDVFIYDFRSFGKSSGDLSEESLFADALLAYDAVAERFPENKIIIYGRSMGTSLAAYVASQRQEQMLVLESPFYELYDATKTFVPGFPPRFLMRYEMPTYDHLANAGSPTVIFHGTDDDVVPFSSGVALYNTVKDKNVRMVPIKGGRHNDLDTFSNFQAERAKIFNH